MKPLLDKKLLSFSVVIITVLLILNIFLTHRNNFILEHNRNLQRQAEDVRVTVTQFAIVLIHNLDLGLRSYALYGKEKYLNPLKFAVSYRDSLINRAEASLINQQYPMEEFYQLRDSIISYEVFCLRLLDLYEAMDTAEFNRLSDQDRGYLLWLQYERFSNNVNLFEDEVNEKAQQEYRAAVKNNYILQILLLVISVPTLLFTAVHTGKKLTVEKQLRESEAEKAMLLAAQNEMLERAVASRTEEVQAKNKELAKQNEALKESRTEQLELYKRNLMEKSEFIKEITQELEVLKGKFVPTPEQIKKFNNILHHNIVTDEDWERFKVTFQEVYPTFFASLRYRFPAITASELRLSAMIKMNLSLKEAADMQGIAPDSVKKSRYRLKKRLGLVDEESLEEFIRTRV